MRLRTGYNFLIISCILIVLILILMHTVNKSPASPIKSEYISYITYINDITINSTQDVDTIFSSKKLLNLTDFSYLLEPNFCKQPLKEVLGLMLITSYAGHDELRSVHRQAVAATKLEELNLQRVFLLAAIPPRDYFITQSQLINEHERFGDLLQGNFFEAYHNLSYKHVMGLQWATITLNKCLKTKFIVKLDDDTVYDIFHIRNYLETMAQLQNDNNKQTIDYLGGYVLHGIPTIRNMANKWYVAPHEYSKNFYPDYLSGWLYIIKPQTALKILKHAYRQSSIFWIDDVWLTGLIRNDLNISLNALNVWFSANSQFLECCIRDLKLGKNLQCDYYVGPNGGNNKMLLEFVRNIEKCYMNKCLKRSKEKDYIRNTCVTSYQKRLPDHGVGIIKKVNLKR